MLIKKILVVSPNYPTKGEPVYTFVKNLCDEFVRKGVSLYILSPQSLTSALIHHNKKRPRVWYDTFEGCRIAVYQPYTITFPYRFWRLYNYMGRLAAMRFLRRNKIEADVCYCHFYRSAYLVLPYIKKNNLPLFVATGEGALLNLKDILRQPSYMEMNKYLNGVICVSSNNKKISEEIGIVKDVDCLVAPNAIDGDLYCKKDKVALRHQYGYNQDDFIVAFVGAFNNRKGPQRVSKAIDKVGNVKSFFIGAPGEGEYIEPSCEGILFKGKLPHEKIPDYLNMADVFVLPTLNEGCCNAIVEALACGLPVVSSNLPFNYDVLNEANSIMIDPNNVDEIVDAIRELKDNKDKRQQLSEGALRMGQELTIDRRAQRILDFMESHI